MSLKITITDIAKSLGITPATVSRALNDHPGISERTKRLVQQEASRLHYNRNKIASSLRSGKTQVIGVIIPSAEINFFGSVVYGIESMANLSGYNVLLYQSNESRDSEVKGLDTFLGARVDGIIVSIAKNTLDYSHFINVKKKGVPLVFFDRANDDLGIPSVVVDDYKGAFYATEHLIRQGYRRIAHVSGPQHIKIFNDRLKGYMGAIQANKMKVDFDLIYGGNVSIESGKESAGYFLSMQHPPDAVFAVEDFTALGLIKELKDNQVKIPDEMGVIGFANELFGKHITPSLSTVDQQTVLMGKEAFNLLMESIRNRDEKETKPRKIVLEPIPIYRDSSVRKPEPKRKKAGRSGKTLV